MLKEKNAVINENQNNKTHSLTNLIILYFKDINFKNDSNVEKTKNK